MPEYNLELYPRYRWDEACFSMFCHLYDKARAHFTQTLATVNTVAAAIEWIMYARTIQKELAQPAKKILSATLQKLNTAPIFVIGHPRSGTTLIHNMLASDPQFSYCTTFQVGFPSSFLCMEWAKRFLGNVISSTRPMDNMALHMDLPQLHVRLSWKLRQEDEIATNLLSGGIRFFTFARASASEFNAWKNAFLWFFKKVTYRNGGDSKRMVIKSPVHTARVRILLEMFPNAQFIYVHRDPYVVLQSAAHMADAYYWYCYLKTPTEEQVTSFIFNQYELLYREYAATKSLIPKGNLVEVRFEDLEKDLSAEIKRIYRELGIKHDGSSLASTEHSCKQVEGFIKNKHKELSPEIKKMAAERWKESFEALGYNP